MSGRNERRWRCWSTKLSGSLIALQLLVDQIIIRTCVCVGVKVNVSSVPVIAASFVSYSEFSPGWYTCCEPQLL